jgi:ribosome maturation factor RimP
VEPIITDYRLELIDIEHHRTPRGWVLRITVDKDGGVTVDDCVRLSREAGYLLEIEELIGHPYHLEVTSPGLERPLKTLEDFGKYIGRKVVVKTATLFRGRRNFKGILQGAHGAIVHLEGGGEVWEIPFSSITQAKLIYELPRRTK